MNQHKPDAPEFPTGTVTFLFTDIEGSTRLLHALGPDGYAEALAEHRRLLREAFAAHGGVEVDTQGDAFFVAFPTAMGAVAAARDGQRVLEPGPIIVRMGIHTGTPTVTAEGYVGVDVHRGARIASLAHGTQTSFRPRLRRARRDGARGRRRAGRAPARPGPAPGRPGPGRRLALSPRLRRCPPAAGTHRV